MPPSTPPTAGQWSKRIDLFHAGQRCLVLSSLLRQMEWVSWEAGCNLVGLCRSVRTRTAVGDRRNSTKPPTKCPCLDPFAKGGGRGLIGHPFLSSAKADQKSVAEVLGSFNSFNSFSQKNGFFRLKINTLSRAPVGDRRRFVGDRRKFVGDRRKFVGDRRNATKVIHISTGRFPPCRGGAQWPASRRR